MSFFGLWYSYESQGMGGWTNPSPLKLIFAISRPYPIHNFLPGHPPVWLRYRRNEDGTDGGFDTAVDFASECIDRLFSTATSHGRLIVVEVMGRYAGWIALNAGMASGAHAILIPEIPFDLEPVAALIAHRERHGAKFSIVCVAEGARPAGGAGSLSNADDGELRAVALAVSDQGRHRLEVKGDLGDQNGVGPRCHTGVEGDPSGVAAHHLHHDQSAMRCRGAEQSVYALRGEVDGGVETAVSPVLVSAISKPDWRVAREKIVNRVGARYGKDQLQRRWIRPAPHPLALITIPKTKK